MSENDHKAEPRCPYFRRCGGCSSQHIDYDTQLENKKQQLANALPEDIRSSTGIKVFHGEPYNYRNRMDFIFHKQGLGFREKGKWFSIIDIKECSISNKKLNSLLTELRGFFVEPDAFHVKRHTGTFRYAVIRTPSSSSSISFVLNPDSTRLKEAIGLIKEYSKTSTADNIIVTYVDPNTDTSISDDYFVVKGTDMLKESYMGKDFIFHVQGFFQNNHEVSNMMHEYVNSLLKDHLTQEKHLLDLYGGVGTFGIINHDLFKSTIIIEGFKQCIDAAEKNIQINNSENTNALCLDDKQLKNQELPSPLYVITDPPRSGMNPKTIKHLNRVKPELIIYVSCNLNQLKKDLYKFQGYKIKSAALFDFFPQTPHAEGVVELVRE